MEDLTRSRLTGYLILFWFLFAMISHLAAVLWMYQYDEEVSMYKALDLSFYYYMPAILWTIYTPLIIRLNRQWNLLGAAGLRPLLHHLSFSLLLAPLSRMLAIALDYSIKNLVGMGYHPIPQVLFETRFIIAASAPRAFFFYWVIVGAVLLCRYFEENRKKPHSEPLAAPRHKDHLWVKRQGGNKRIDTNEIFWISAARNYVHIHTADECYRLRRSLAGLLEELDERRFLRIHRSKVVNKSAVDTLKHWRRGEYLITLKNRKLLTSTRTYHTSIRAFMAE